MNQSKKAYRINVKYPVYAILTADTSEGANYGEVKSLGEAQTIGVTASVASGSLYGDGAKVDSSSKLTGLTVSLDLTKVPIEAQQEIYNNEVVDGVVIDKSTDQPNQIAVGYMVEQTNGANEYVWLLKGTPRPMNSSVQQSEDNLNYSTDTMEVDFVRRVFDNAFRYRADSANPDFTEEQASKWFAQAPSQPVAKES